jgi:hypothetical protein
MSRADTVVFGAFDRHNLGDLLLAHVVAARLPPPAPLPAGLAPADLTGVGGFAVEAIAERLRQGAAFDLVHAGGELLTCSAWEAAVMLEPPARARALVRGLDARARLRRAWAQARLGRAVRAPYVVSRAACPPGSRVFFHAVGGAGLARLPRAMQAEVTAALAGADHLSVRDHVTRALLARRGIAADLVPDPVADIAGCFSERIRAGSLAAPLRCIAEALPQGWLAVQVASEFGDVSTCAALAAGLDRIAAATGLGVALFRAGAAPWHDDRATLRAIGSSLRRARWALSEALDVWAICALIASARGFVGSSLHARIVAGAFGLPRLTVLAPAEVAGRGGRHRAYVETWEPEALRAIAAPADFSSAALRALAVPRARLMASANEQASASRAALQRLGRALEAG